MQGEMRIINLPAPGAGGDPVSLEHLQGADFGITGLYDLSDGNLILPRNTGEPTGPGDGQTYWDPNLNNLYIWDGTTWVNINATASIYHVVYVTPVGSDITGNGSLGRPYKTLKYALSTITDNTVSNTYTIQIAPGVYIEENPIQLKPYVTVRGVGGLTVNIIEAANPSQALIVGSAETTMRYLTLSGATGAEAYLMNSAGLGVVVDIKIRDCQIGIMLSHASAVISASAISASTTGSNVIDKLLCVTAGSLNTVNVVVGANADMTTYAHAIGSSSNITIGQGLSAGSNTTNGLLAEDSATIICADIGLTTPNYAVRVKTGGHVRGNNVFVGDVSTYDIWQEDATGIVDFTAATINVQKLQITDWSNIIIDFVSRLEDNPGHHFTKTLNVGVAEKGYESCFGEGFPTVRGMRIYNYDNSTFTDVTDVAASPSGSTFTMGTDIDDAVYVTWDLINSDTADYSKFFGLFNNVTTAMVEGAGSAQWEYWDGDSWELLTEMVTEARSPYYPSNGHSFEYTGLHNIRFNNHELNNHWAKSNPPGTGPSTYWLRFRITTAITTGPTIQYIKMHTNRTEINADGWLEYFGNARPIGRLPWDIGLLEPAVDSPSDQDVYLSDNLDVGRLENMFENATVDRSGFVGHLPFDFDTSCPIKLRVSMFSVGTSGGNIRWVLRIAKSSDGDSVYETRQKAPPTAPEQTEIISILPAPSTLNVQLTHEFEFDVSQMVSRRSSGFGDLLWITLERTGNHGDDTHNDDIAAISISAYYTRWCEGGHSTD